MCIITISVVCGETLFDRLICMHSVGAYQREQKLGSNYIPWKLTFTESRIINFVMNVIKIKYMYRKIESFYGIQSL